MKNKVIVRVPGGKELKALRKLAGMTQSFAGETIANVTKCAWAKWEDELGVDGSSRWPMGQANLWLILNWCDMQRDEIKQWASEVRGNFTVTKEEPKWLKKERERKLKEPFFDDIPDRNVGA